LGHESQIDYILFPDIRDIISFGVMDSSINFLDHLPLYACFSCSTQPTPNQKVPSSHTQLQLRWDKADTSYYYLITGIQLEPSLRNLDDIRSLYEHREITDNDIASRIDCVYDEIVSIVHDCAIAVVPQT